jgi:hypothetical protein
VPVVTRSGLLVLRSLLSSVFGLGLQGFVFRRLWDAGMSSPPLGRSLPVASTSCRSLSPASPPATPSALLQPLLMLGAESAPANLAMESLCSSDVSGVEVAVDGGLVPLVMVTAVASLSSVEDDEGVELAQRTPLVAAPGRVSDVLPVSCKVGNGLPPERLGSLECHGGHTQPGLQVVGAAKMLPVSC